MKKIIITTIMLCIALSLTGCLPKNEQNKKGANNQSSSQELETIEDLKAKLAELYQQENQLFYDHSDVWNKVFSMMNKSNADSSVNYAQYLADTVNANKASFNEQELKTLEQDIKTIQMIEEQIEEIQSKIDKSSSSEEDDSDETIPFKTIIGNDFEGNKIDETLFSKNAVTVINFWFTGCSPCVAELSKFEEINNAIKSQGGEVIGVNTETFDGNKAAIEEAKRVLESLGAKYRNLSLSSNSDLGKYAKNLIAFPTTILVDRNGKIVGEPLLGGIDIPENYDYLMNQIQSIINADITNNN